MMLNSYTHDRIFNPHLTTIKNSYNLSLNIWTHSYSVTKYEVTNTSMFVQGNKQHLVRANVLTLKYPVKKFNSTGQGPIILILI